MTQTAQSSRGKNVDIMVKFKRFQREKRPRAKVKKIRVKRAVDDVAPPHSLNTCDERDAESRE